MDQESLVALPTTLSPLTSVRSTLIQSSLNTLRQRGHFDRYRDLVHPEHRETILGSLAPEWLPIDVAMAHYAACDALQMSAQELHEIGEEVGNRIQGTFLDHIVRRARAMGLTPWIPLAQIGRLWERLFEGGAPGLTKVGPKDAMVDLRNLKLCRYAYFRAAFCGVLTSGIKLGAGRAVHTRILDLREPEHRMRVRVEWV
ncbi:MAG: hypothetical protein QM778_31725 [Myxococcales bacterium]